MQNRNTTEPNETKKSPSFKYITPIIIATLLLILQAFLDA